MGARKKRAKAREHRKAVREEPSSEPTTGGSHGPRTFDEATRISPEHLESRDPDVVLFTAALSVKRFLPKNDVSEEVRRALNAALSDRHVRQCIVSATARSSEIQHDLGQGRLSVASKALRDLMYEVAHGLASVPSSLRSVLWRYAWERGRKSRKPLKTRRRTPIELVPEGFSPHVFPVMRYSGEAVMNDGRVGPYAGLFFDPRLATDTDIKAAVNRLRASFDSERTRAPSAAAKAKITAEAQMLAWLLEHTRPRGLRRQARQNWEELKGALQMYRERNRVSEPLWKEIQRRIHQRTGECFDETTIGKALRAWKPPPYPPTTGP